MWNVLFKVDSRAILIDATPVSLIDSVHSAQLFYVLIHDFEHKCLQRKTELKYPSEEKIARTLVTIKNLGLKEQFTCHS